MAIIKCKMCGGDLNIIEGASTAECEFCGSLQTVPKVDDEKKLALFGRANRLRTDCDFDKAAGIYETILGDFPEETEAYWGIVLCKYGIEYVDDPTTSKKVPTCRRTLPTSIMEDPDCRETIQKADILSRRVYQAEAEQIDQIQKKILSIVSKEQPYDVFICYKETDDDTLRRTEDSGDAQDLFTELTKEGYRVFFARNTLKAVAAGSEYEPYIYAALNSAKVMLAIGSRAEYFQAVWVKNEWARYLDMMKNRPDKVLIPCYKNVDPYDMPREFRNLQALNMADITFYSTLKENLERVIPKKEVKNTATTVFAAEHAKPNTATIESLLKRVHMFLEDGDWTNADAYCEKVLDIEPENAQAYLGKLLVELRVHNQEELSRCPAPFDDKNNYKKVIRYADPEVAKTISGYVADIKKRNEAQRIEAIYQDALKKYHRANSEEQYKEAARCFSAIPNFQTYKDAEVMIGKCLEEAEKTRIEAIYQEGLVAARNATTETAFLQAAQKFDKLGSYKDSQERGRKCRENAEDARKKAIYDKADSTYKMANTKIAFLSAKEQFETIADWKDAKKRIADCDKGIKKLAAERRSQLLKKIAVTCLIVFCIVGVLSFVCYFLPMNKYDKAMEHIQLGEYDEAYAILEELGSFSGADEAIKADKYARVNTYIETGDNVAAYRLIEQLTGYADCEKLIEQLVEQDPQIIFKAAEEGDIIVFGRYEQDNNLENGQEDIEWIVIENEQGKLLLVSKYCLDCKPYNLEEESAIWETSYLREWLNSDFYNAAFSEEEKTKIPLVLLSNSTEDFGPSNDTHDKVFALSYEERWVSLSKENHLAKPTAYAKANGVWVDPKNGNSTWWLRNTGITTMGPEGAFAIYSTGEVSTNLTSNNTEAAVRPGIWLTYE